MCRQLIVYNYNLASHLCKLLTPFIPTAHCTKGSFTFIKDIQEVSTKDAFMVTYDVCSLFTNTLLRETIDVAVTWILKYKKYLKFSENELTELFCFPTSQPHFYFEEKIFNQVDWVTMGSLLGPTLANLFFGYYEQKWLEFDHGRLVKFHCRYEDNIFFCFWKWTSGSDFLWVFKHSKPELKFHYRERAYETNHFWMFSILLQID